MTTIGHSRPDRTARTLGHVNDPDPRRSKASAAADDPEPPGQQDRPKPAGKTRAGREDESGVSAPADGDETDGDSGWVPM
jgi:hypothetical protein